MSAIPPRILIVAGSDSSGGAGIQADIKTVTMLGGYAMTAITAITAQNTLGVKGVEAMSAEMVGAQIDACAGDIGIDAIKIGMLGSAEVAKVVADRLERLDCPIVFDPVMIATSGSVLADDNTVAAFERLMDLAWLITPNVAEFEALGGAASLLKSGQYNCLVTGGDDVDGRAQGLVGWEPNDPQDRQRQTQKDGFVSDYLSRPDAPDTKWSSPRIDTKHTHGTGCTLSSAITTFLGVGMDLPQAISRAREFVRLALHDAPGFGAKAGPLGHQAVRMDLTGEPRLNQITVPVRDYQEAVSFYGALGLTQIVDSPSNGYARFECPGGMTLSISTDHGAIGGAGIYFECLDLDAFTRQLSAKGIVCPPPQDQSWHWRECWITDPSGNRICIYQAGENRRYPPWRMDL